MAPIKKKSDKDNPFAAQREAFKADNNRTFASYLKGGVTFAYIVAVGDSPSYYFEETEDIYRGKSTKRFAIQAVVLGADNETGLRDGWNGAVVAMVVPKSLCEAITEECYLGSKLSHVDEKGAFHPGTLFMLGKHGAGLKTRYSVHSADIADLEGVTVPRTVVAMEETLVDFSDAYRAYQQKRSDEWQQADGGGDTEGEAPW